MKTEQKNTQQLRVVIVGHVDHGKSTLIGRLLYDTDSLPEGKYEELQAICKRRGTDALEWSFVLDSFQAERDQAITIDTTQIWFSTDQRDYVIIDAPGHREFLKNMVSGAAAADAAILVVDATEGVREQTKRHAYLLSLLGLRQVAVVINKMDMVKHSTETFAEVSKQVDEYLSSIGIRPSFIVPISARNGDMISVRGDNLDWYRGKSLVDVLDAFEVESPPLSRALRFPVQDVYRYGERRIIVGRIETGILRTGDTLLFSPTNEQAVVTSIETWPEDPDKVEAHAGESVGITLDERIFVERGHFGSHTQNPPMLSNVFRANIFWLSSNPLKVGNSYKIRYGTHEAMVTVQSIDRVINTNDLAQTEKAGEVGRNAVGEVTLRARDLLPIDPYTDNARTGRVVLYDGYDIAGGGTVNMEGYPDQRSARAPKSENIYKVEHLLSHDVRARSMGHRGGTFWFTGLSGAGKSTLAMAVEKSLFEKGYHTYVLDGDNVRHGLNADLGFSPKDRAENIRRIGEVAALMADAGLIVITAFISPYRADRNRARAASPERFHEIHVQADLQTCEGRDPKGLYKKARSGQIADFTGIDSPYEAPENPEMVVDTQHNDVETCVEQILRYVEQQVALSAATSASGTGEEKAIAS
ncbi:MAG: adenylyl-sulfate kinase [Alphaproteobacteria bacterium]|nr:adenylyl-sulfate kinase [Alphaproteobacteria bacterium]